MELVVINSKIAAIRVLDTPVQFRKNNSAASSEHLKRNYLNCNNRNFNSRSKPILIIHMTIHETEDR